MPERPKHRLVCLGDSVSQGFNNGGIYRTELSYPALLAHCMQDTPFDQPSFVAQAGIPLNLEVLVRGLQEKYGPHISNGEWSKAVPYMYRTVKRIKRYWEGEMTDLSVDRDTPWHNQSVWGFSINDAWIMNEARARHFIKKYRPRYSVFSVLPDNAMYVTARRVLNASFGETFQHFTPLDNVRWLQDHGGIENLIVALGSNNIVGAISELEIRYSKESELEAPPPERNHTVYRPEHFEQELQKLARLVDRIDAQRVFIPTIPRVTLIPAMRGVQQPGHHQIKQGYYDYYTHFWIWDADFNPDLHPHLTRKEAIELDILVEEYNRMIKQTAHKYGWTVVPLARFVDGLPGRTPSRRHRTPTPKKLQSVLQQYDSLQGLKNDQGDIQLTTHYLQLDEQTGSIRRGGIFSLDGMHPTNTAYGLIAELFYQTMQRNGVRFEQEMPWKYIVANDTLLNNPPQLLIQLRHVLRYLSMGHRERISELSAGILSQFMDYFNGRKEVQMDTDE
jgi:lysophospholipase L1-like esterase